MNEASINEGSPEGNGQRKCPWWEYSSQGRGTVRFLGEHKGYWCISLPPLHWALGTCAGKGQRVHQGPSFCFVVPAEGGHHTQVSFPTPSVIRITIGVAFPLVLGPLSVINFTLVFPHMSGDATQVKSLLIISLNQTVPKTGNSQSDVHSFSRNSCRRGVSLTISS